MPELIYALICADLIIDKDSNSTSFIRTIEHAVVPEFPTTLPPIYFASLWNLEKTEKKPFTVSLNLVPPQGKPLTLGLQEVPPTDAMLHKMNFQLPGLQVKEEGKHELTVALKRDEAWETLSKIPFYVFKNTPQ